MGDLCPLGRLQRQGPTVSGRDGALGSPESTRSRMNNTVVCAGVGVGVEQHQHQQHQHQHQQPQPQPQCVCGGQVCRELRFDALLGLLFGQRVARHQPGRCLCVAAEKDQRPASHPSLVASSAGGMHRGGGGGGGGGEAEDL